MKQNYYCVAKRDSLFERVKSIQLVEVVRDREKIDENLIIFQKNKADFDSDVVLFQAEEGDEGD